MKQLYILNIGYGNILHPAHIIAEINYLTD